MNMTSPPLKARDPTEVARDRVKELAHDAISEPWKRRDAVDAIMRRYVALLAKKRLIEADEWLDENLAYLEQMAAENKKAPLKKLGGFAGPIAVGIKIVYDNWPN